MTLKFQNPGYVYIMSNESLNFLKIGYTQNSPYDRAAQLYETGVPTPFSVEKFYFVEDAPQCEELVHMRLTRFRINNEREFFKVDRDKAERVIEQAIDDLRERLWAKTELKNDAKNESTLVVQYSYSNPKFKDMMKLLKENRKLLTVEEIASDLKISTGGVDKLIKMFESQEGKVLYSREENKVKKYSIALGFNVEQLNLMSEKYPALNLNELAPLFEKPKNNYNNKGNGYKPQYKAKTQDTAQEPTKKPWKSQYNKNNSGNSQPNNGKEVKQFLEEKIVKNNNGSKPILNNPNISEQDRDKMQSLIERGRKAYEDVIASDKMKKYPKPN